MTDGLNESTNEQSLLRWLDNLGWTVHGGPNDIAEGGAILNDQYDRELDEPILWSVVREQLIQLNPKVNQDNVESVITRVQGEIAEGQSLLETNRNAHNLLTTGCQVTLQQPQKEPVTIQVKLVDFDTPQRNSLIAANQVRFKPNGKSIRPDVTLFVNGFPIVQGELKSSGQGANVGNAIRDLRHYEQSVPDAFETALFNFGADTHNFYVGAVGAGAEQYQPWNKAPPEYRFEDNPFKQAAHATLSPNTLLNILKRYVFYEEGNSGLAKITPRYMQYYASEKIISRVEPGNATRGLIWHTQGSGKTYTMIYTAHQLIEADWFPSPQIIILVDTDDLRGQLTNTFNNIGYDHRFETAESMEHLEDIVSTGQSGVIVTTVQMFEEAPSGLQGNENTVLLTDEAHRYMEQHLGNRLEGAFSNEDDDPTAHHYGFTGTPVNERVRNTFRNYHDEDPDNSGRAYLDRYSIKQGIDDGVILPVNFEIRTDISWRVNDLTIDERFDEITEGIPDEEKQDAIRETITGEQLSELRSRVQALSQDILEHYTEKLEPNGWKGMVVTPSREAAKRYGETLRERHDSPDDIRVVISSERTSTTDGESIEPVATPRQDSNDDDDDLVVEKGDREQVIRSFKEDESPKLFVVCDMLLTGFDAPILKAMYLDKKLKDHNLLQAIARVNRPADGKHNGLIVDYKGALSNLEDALQYDDEVVQEYAVAEEDELLDEFETVLEELDSLFESDVTAPVERQEDIATLVSEVGQKRDQFKEKADQIENIYESLSPHPGLGEYDTQYERINKIRLELQAVEDPDTGTGTTDIGQKTVELLEDGGVEVELLGKKYPTYQLDGDALGEISEVPPEIEVIHVGKGLQKILERRRQQNPRYDRLSERLKNILEEWDNNMRSATETLAALKRIEEHAQEIEETRENPDLNHAEYAIYLTLRDEHNDAVPTEEDAVLLAEEIDRQFQENVTRDFLGWKADPDTQKDIRNAVIMGLQECNKLGALYDADGFVDACVQYLIENHS